MRQIRFFIVTILFLIPLLNLYSLNLPQVLKGTPFEQEELRAISLANKGQYSEAIPYYNQLIKSTNKATPKARLQLNLLNLYKAESEKTANQIPYLKELQSILNSYSVQKEITVEAKSQLLNQAITEFKRCVDILINQALSSGNQPTLIKQAIEYVKLLLKYKYYSNISSEYQERLASLYELNNEKLNAAGIYLTLASKHEKNLKKPESRSIYIDYLSKVINLLQNEINWKNPFLAVGYTAQIRSVKGLSNVQLNQSHPSLSNILKALLSAYQNLERVRPGFINSINISLIQYKLNDKDLALKTFINITTKSDTPYNDFCLDILDMYNQQKDYLHLVQFAKHLITQKKSTDTVSSSTRYLQQILPVLASNYVNEKDYNKAFYYFVEFYKTFPKDPRTNTLWPQFMVALDGTTDHRGYEDWCNYYIDKTSDEKSIDFRTEKTKSLMLNCITHATDTTYDTNKINFSFEYLKRFSDSKEAATVRDDTGLFLIAKGKYKSVYKLYQPLLNYPATALVAGRILLNLDAKYGTQASGVELANSIILQQNSSPSPNKDLISLALVRLTFIEIENQEQDKVKKLEQQILSYKSTNPEVLNALSRIRLTILDYSISEFLDFDLDSIGLVNPIKMLDTEFSKYNKIKTAFDSVCSKNPSIYCPKSLQSVLELTKKFSRRINNIDQSQISSAKLHDYKTKKFHILNQLKKIQTEYENKINSSLLSSITHPQVVNGLMFESSGDFNFYPISSSPSYGYVNIPLKRTNYVYELGTNKLLGTDKKVDYFIKLSKSNRLSSTDRIFALILARQGDSAIKAAYSYLKNNPRNKSGLEALYLSLLVTKRYPLAGYYASLYQKYYPATSLSLSALAISKITSSQLDTKDIEDTIFLLEQASNLNSSSYVAAVNLIKVYLETAQISKGASLLSKLPSSFPSKALLEVQSDIIHKNYAHGQSLIKDFLKVNPKNAEALYKQAVLTNLLGNRRDAIKQLKSLRQRYSSTSLFEGRIDSLLFRLEEKGEVSL